MLMIVSGLLFSAMGAMIKYIAIHLPNEMVVFFRSAMGLMALLGTAVSAIPLAWRWQAPEPGLWALLVIMGFVGSLAQSLLTRAYSYAPAAHVGPFSYSTVVFAAGFGWLVWGEAPDLLSFAGTLLVCLAGILTIRIAGRRAVPLAEVPRRR